MSDQNAENKNENKNTINKPPLSEAQLLANFLNAQKSTGPRTESGKARSSMNALKSGP